MIEKLKINLLGLILFLGISGSLSAPLEEAQFLRQIADQYSPPFVISLLHSRMQSTHEMIEKIKASQHDLLPKPKREMFDLADKTIQSLDDQLISLEKTGYFNFDGKDKVNYFIEQFIMLNKLQPIDFGSYGLVQSSITPDSLLEQFKTQTPGLLISQIGNLIKSYLSDLSSKEFSSNYDQKLLISIIKRELQSILDHLRGININSHNEWLNGIEKVLRSLKTTVDLFYSQFNYLADQRIEPSELDVPTSRPHYERPYDENYGTTTRPYYEWMPTTTRVYDWRYRPGRPNGYDYNDYNNYQETTTYSYWG